MFFSNITNKRETEQFNLQGQTKLLFKQSYLVSYAFSKIGFCETGWVPKGVSIQINSVHIVIANVSGTNFILPVQPDHSFARRRWTPTETPYRHPSFVNRMKQAVYGQLK